MAEVFSNVPADSKEYAEISKRADPMTVLVKNSYQLLYQQKVVEYFFKRYDEKRDADLEDRPALPEEVFAEFPRGPRNDYSDHSYVSRTLSDMTRLGILLDTAVHRDGKIMSAYILNAENIDSIKVGEKVIKSPKPYDKNALFLYHTRASGYPQMKQSELKSK